MQCCECASRMCVHALVQSRCGVQPLRGRCIWLWVDELIKAIRITETEHSAMITRDWETGEGEMLLEFPEVCFTTRLVSPTLANYTLKMVKPGIQLFVT